MKKLLTFKWAKKTAARSERGVQSTLQGSNEYYRNLFQQFTSSCHTPNGDISDPDWIVYRPKEQNADQSSKKGNGKSQEQLQFISGVPHIQTSEIFEIGGVMGTESQFLKLVSAEWHNMKVTLKKSIFPSCQDAIKREIEVLREIRHPNILLLMGTTHTNTQELISIFESVDCTLYNYIHERGEQMNTQGIMQVGLKLADILKYCHMRGYIHTAVSSRCVYFTSNNNVKLGGWEMAVEVGVSYQFHEYEKYLRLENLKWEPPGICYEEYHNKKIDVYGLMLLLWEMCTGCVPRNGYRSNVERHFMIRKHDIMLSLQNVPPILHDLLETGLHADETKMTLDMDKIGRRLHRLLMIYEEEEKSSMSKFEGNNNNDLLYNDNNALHKKTFSVSLIQNKALSKKPFTKSHCPMMETKSFSNQFLKFKKKYDEDLDPKNNVKKIDESVDDSIVSSSMINVRATTPCSRCSEISDMMYNMDEMNDARANIKRLKELIATKREDFFFGNDSILSSYSNPKATSTLLSEERSPDCITCKPANHTITLEPKCNKSPSEYNGTIPKLSYMSQRKTPYPSMPASIKHAIIQPRVLHPDAKSFYESTLWRKEKEICLSRMARDSKEQTGDLSLLRQSNYNDTPITDDDKAQYSKTDLTNTDATYTVEYKEKGDYTEDNKEPPLNVKSDYVSTNVLNFSNKSIQNLKDALDRATKIVHLVTPKIRNPELDWTNTQEFETVFKDLYETTYDNNQKITITEKLTPNNFSEIDDIRKTESNIEATRHEEIFNQAFIKNETFSSTTTKTSNESQMSTQEQQSKNFQKTDQNNMAFTNKIISNPQQTEVNFKTHEMKYANANTIANSITIKDSPRRRSLPARLNTLTIMSIPKITCRKNMPVNQYLTEDIYIDDEFGSRLNYNLVLLDDELHLLNTTLNDIESLPQTTDL